ncbi:cupin domain-containing protein [Sandaracinobacter sp. RS1-74]|uniref:cupin domain-containing protein n=1 Tax=Sandaracinobacteroides sayramensis TaxID=2913411 RepID=UPI001EDB6138|nr:cupin domain-containing protein [Sandaracinobacteroides sayramensis]MCG2840629.1 cupin domain-containing protein [Sandaracinobacteroides sayramensis]
MHHIIRAAETSKAPNRTWKFEGEHFGAGISFFAVDLDRGQGPGLHIHPYAETWLVLSGMVDFEVQDESLFACTGDVVIVPAHTPHRFTNSGDQPLTMVCIHDHERVIQHFLNDRPPGQTRLGAEYGSP